MAQFLGFGNGHDGTVPTSGVVNTYATVTATYNTNTVTTTLSVSVGDMVLLHQSQAASSGFWELVTVGSTGAGSFTSDQVLVNTYSSGAQAVLIPQYTGGTISGTVYPSSWNGSTGGITALVCSGPITISGTLDSSGVGFRGGISNDVSGNNGEGYPGWSFYQYPNGNGGAGGTKNNNYAGGGGGGANGAAGSSGGSSASGNPPQIAVGGNAAGSADLSTMYFGGGGGRGGSEWSSGSAGNGGPGGGIIILFAPTITVTGVVSAYGWNGSAGTAQGGDGGGGAGGSVLIKGQVVTIGTDKVGANSGSGANHGGSGGAGGNGSVGRVRIEYCSLSGSISSLTPSLSTGGNPWCYIMPSAVI